MLDASDSILLLFIFWLLATVVWSISQTLSLRTIFSYLLFAVLYFVVKWSLLLVPTCARRMALISKLHKLYSFGVTAIATWLLFYSNFDIRRGQDSIGASGVALLLLFSIPWVLLACKTAKTPLKGFAYAGLALWQAGIILATQSRAGAAALLVLAMLSAFWARGIARRPLLLMLICVPILATALLLLGAASKGNAFQLSVFGAYERTSALVSGLISRNQEVVVASLGDSRLATYEYAIEAVNENWFLGVGYGSDRKALSERHHRELIIHGDALRVLVGAGIVGLTLYVAHFLILVGKMFREGGRIGFGQGATFEGDFFSVSAALLIAIFLYMLFNPVLYWPVVWFFWATISSALRGAQGSRWRSHAIE